MEATKSELQRDFADLLELVNLDLKGQIDESGLVHLRSDPHRWLGVLHGVLQNVKDQMAARALAVECELAKDIRSEHYHERTRVHRDWRRKAARFRDVVEARMHQVRSLIPEDDLRALLMTACQLDPENAEGIRAWQGQARKALAV